MAKLADKVAAQKKIKVQEEKREERRFALYTQQDGISQLKDKLIEKTRARMVQTVRDACVFMIRWRVA